VTVMTGAVDEDDARGERRVSHVYLSYRVDARSHDLSSYRVDVDLRNFLVAVTEKVLFGSVVGVAT